MTDPTASRRSLLQGAAVAGVAVPVLAACGSTESTPVADPVDSTQAPGGGLEVAAADVPVGSGVILSSEQVVVTQPEAGTYKAFSAVCPHEKCLVSKIERDAITCTCHGSIFSAADGSVLNGPANSPLPERTVTVAGDKLTIA